MRAMDEQRGKVLGRIVLAHITANPESEVALSVKRLLAEQFTRAPHANRRKARV
jgi:hypothetical protein